MSTPLVINASLLSNISLGADSYVAKALLGSKSVSMDDLYGPLTKSIAKCARYGKDNQTSTRPFKHSATKSAEDFIRQQGFTPISMDDDELVIGLMLKSGYQEINAAGEILFQRPVSSERPIEVACFDHRGRRVTINPKGEVCLRWQESEGWTIRKVAHGKYFKDQQRIRTRAIGDGETLTEIVRLGDSPTTRTILETPTSIVITETGIKARITQNIIMLDEQGRPKSIISSRGKEIDTFEYSHNEVYRNGKLYLGVNA